MREKITAYSSRIIHTRNSTEEFFFETNRKHNAIYGQQWDIFQKDTAACNLQNRKKITSRFVGNVKTLTDEKPEEFIK